jgi:hypothetical protein
MSDGFAQPWPQSGPEMDQKNDENLHVFKGRSLDLTMG